MIWKFFKFSILIFYINTKTKTMSKETRDYEMFTPAGNRACDSLVKKIEKKIFGTKRVTKDQILSLASAGVKKIIEKHYEVDDSEPPYHISFFINKALKQTGYAFEIDRWEF